MKVLEFYIDISDSKGNDHTNDNLVEIEVSFETDYVSHEFGREQIKRPQINSVMLNGVSLAGGQKNLILTLLGGQDKLLKGVEL